MKIKPEAKSPGPTAYPFDKGGLWGIYRYCSEATATRFHSLCCADRYMITQCVVNAPNSWLRLGRTVASVDTSKVLGEAGKAFASAREEAEEQGKDAAGRLKGCWAEAPQ